MQFYDSYVKENSIIMYVYVCIDKACDTTSGLDNVFEFTIIAIAIYLIESVERRLG